MAAQPAAENHMPLNTITRGLVEHIRGQTSHYEHQMAMWLRLRVMNWLMSDASSHKYRWPKQWSIVRRQESILQVHTESTSKNKMHKLAPMLSTITAQGPLPLLALTVVYKDSTTTSQGRRKKIVCTDISPKWMEIFYRFIQWWAWKTRENSINEQNIVANTFYGKRCGVGLKFILINRHLQI